MVDVIKTYFLRPTARNGARVKAVYDRFSAIVPYDHATPWTDNAGHHAAALALLAKMGRGGKWLAGDLGNCNVYVSIPAPMFERTGRKGAVVVLSDGTEWSAN